MMCGCLPFFLQAVRPTPPKTAVFCASPPIFCEKLHKVAQNKCKMCIKIVQMGENQREVEKEKEISLDRKRKECYNGSRIGVAWVYCASTQEFPRPADRYIYIILIEKEEYYANI